MPLFMCHAQDSSCAAHTACQRWLAQLLDCSQVCALQLVQAVYAVVQGCTLVEGCKQERWLDCVKKRLAGGSRKAW